MDLLHTSSILKQHPRGHQFTGVHCRPSTSLHVALSPMTMSNLHICRRGPAHPSFQYEQIEPTLPYLGLRQQNSKKITFVEIAAKFQLSNLQSRNLFIFLHLQLGSDTMLISRIFCKCLQSSILILFGQIARRADLSISVCLLICNLTLPYT